MYKDFHTLLIDNPEAVKSDNGGYLERPFEGWIESTNGFIGIGYHGNEIGDFNDNWVATEKGQGHIPTNGYG